MKPGNIILINGTSSSGKTTILHALQDILEEPYLEAGIDKYIWSLPRRYLDRPLWDDVLGRADHCGLVGQKLVQGMHRAVVALSLAGCNVIADHVLVEPAWAQDCANLFADLPAWCIGLHCPLEVLERRESSRQDRTLGQARLQHDIIHKYALYDLEVDTSVCDPQECAQLIRSGLLKPPQALGKMRQMI